MLGGLSFCERIVLVEYAELGSTGINVSRIAFGAGPIPQVMIGDSIDTQVQVVRRAIEAGINWFDTAATYGNGASETALGNALSALNIGQKIHIATKVRLMPDDLDNIPTAIRRSVTGSLDRLGVNRITLLQLHNSITPARGDEPTSLTPTDVLEPVLSTFQELKAEGLISHCGLTAIGRAESLRNVIRSGEFATIQVPYSLLNPSAGHVLSSSFEEADYGNVIEDCRDMRMGVFAIRVLAGGVLANQPPAPHTFKTQFFPLDLFKRDEQRREQLRESLPRSSDLTDAAMRFVLSDPRVSSAIVGVSEAAHIDAACQAVGRGALDEGALSQLRSFDYLHLSETR